MDIAKLRSQTASARSSIEANEDAEFNSSPLREYFDRLIQNASARGESKVSPNFYYAKEQVLGERYGGPSIEAAIRHYSREGFSAHQESWCSPNGYGNTSLIISWM